MTSDDQKYYTTRRLTLLAEFSKTIMGIEDLFLERYDSETTQELMKRAQDEYRNLIPQLPYIGGKQPFTQYIISTAWFLSMYRVLKEYGEGVEEVGKLAFEASDRYLQIYPGFTRHFLGFITFSPLYLRTLKKRAKESQERKYAGDFVYDFVDGDRREFDYGVDYIECGTCKFLTAQGAQELAPYICPADILYSEILGWGLSRTETLAEGYDRCDFRFKKGGETSVAVPENIQDFIESKRKGTTRRAAFLQ
jgi:hypothetical protein